VLRTRNFTGRPACSQNGFLKANERFRQGCALHEFTFFGAISIIALIMAL